jgi:prephenate dehydrogenase
VPRLFERVTIAGVGLIGGSLALAARGAGLVGEVVGLGRTEANLRTAKKRGIVDRYSRDPREAARDADLLLLAVPVRACASVARACVPVLRSGAVVTDAGSVKAELVRSVEAVLPEQVPFVGAHPIAGGEQAGAAAAVPDLFRGHRCILTPGSRATPEAVGKIRALWEGVGMQVVEMGAQEHDRALAWVSHLPHALAFSLVNALAASDAGLAEHGGPSFRDLTRVAASPTEVWLDIFLSNGPQLAAAMGEFAAAFEELRAAVAAGDEAGIADVLRRARQQRRIWSGEDDASDG